MIRPRKQLLVIRLEKGGSFTEDSVTVGGKAGGNKRLSDGELVHIPEPIDLRYEEHDTEESAREPMQRLNYYQLNDEGGNYESHGRRGRK